MSTTIELTVGDTGITIPGTIMQREIGQLGNLTGCSLKFSLINTSTGAFIVNEATAQLGTFDAASNSVGASYRLQAADVANPVSQAKVRWTFVLPDGGKFHAPGARAQQTFVRINP
jgi:hypothetical protein